MINYLWPAALMGLLLGAVLFWGEGVWDFLGDHRFYVSTVLALVWPWLVLFAIYRRGREGRRGRRSSPGQRERDRRLFASIGTLHRPPGADGQRETEGWPLGYMGFDSKAATDEVIERTFGSGEQEKKAGS